MRNIGVVFILVIIMVFSSGAALALPQYYRFNGVVRAIEGDNPTIAARQGFEIGEKVEYLFMVDAFVMGKVIYTNGEVYYDNNEVYAELISGPALKEIDNGYYIDKNGAAAGRDGNGPLSRNLHLASIGKDVQKQILIGNEDENIIINSNSAGTWNGYLHAYDSKGRKATVYLDLTLSAVTDEIPVADTEQAPLVPEFAAMFLVGTSLLSVAGVAHKKKKRLMLRGALPVSSH